MANVDRPNGFIPRHHGAGGTPNRLGAYTIVNPSVDAFFSGDLVRATGLADSDGIPIIEPCAAGETAVGVFAGVRYVDVNGDQQFRPHLPSGTTMTVDPRSPIEALVYDDPDQLFMVQVAGTLVVADVGQNMDIVAGAGNVTTGRSGFELDQTTVGASGQCQVIQLDRLIGNEVGADSKVLCLIAEHQRRAAVAGF